MWQRFTERARKVIFYAQEEAQHLGEGYVSTEHILLGLVREDDSSAGRILETLGVSLSGVRAELMKNLPRGDARSSPDMTLTPRAKRVIDLAYDEARDLNNNYIGTEHLLLGLIREGDGIAGRVLAKLGVNLEAARRVTISFQDKGVDSRSRRSPEDISSEAASRPLSARRLSQVYGSVFRGLIARMAAEPPDHLVHAAALVAHSSAKPLAPAYLILMVLQNPSLELSAALEALGTRPEDLADVIMASFANFQDEVDSRSISLNELLSRAQTEMNELGHSTLKDAHLVLAALTLITPLVTAIFQSVGITAENLRAQLARKAPD